MASTFLLLLMYKMTQKKGYVSKTIMSLDLTQ